MNKDERMHELIVKMIDGNDLSKITLSRLIEAILVLMFHNKSNAFTIRFDTLNVYKLHDLIVRVLNANKYISINDEENCAGKRCYHVDKLNSIEIYNANNASIAIYLNKSNYLSTDLEVVDKRFTMTPCTISFTSQRVVAKTRKLNAKWTLDMLEDFT